MSAGEEPGMAAKGIETELKPCPFCGGDAGKLYASGGVCLEPARPAPLFGCSKCQFGLPSARLWNTRTSPQPDQETVERIIAKIDRQAECLEGYAEQCGHHAKPVPSVFHSQAMHFRDIAQELRAALATLNPGIGGEVEKLRERVRRLEKFAERIAVNSAVLADDEEQSASSRRMWAICLDDARAALSTPSEQEADRG